MIVTLAGLNFEEDTNPRNETAGSVYPVSLTQWEQDVAHDGWSGYLYLAQNPPRISNGPGSFGCTNGVVTGSPTG
jgi:hypothetical protein